MAIRQKIGKSQRHIRIFIEFVICGQSQHVTGIFFGSNLGKSGIDYILSLIFYGNLKNFCDSIDKTISIKADSAYFDGCRVQCFNSSIIGETDRI